MKNLSSMLVAITAVAASVPATAQGDVASKYAHWEKRLRDRVNEELVYPIGAEPASGDVLVSFRIGSAGKPVDVTVYRSSDNPVFDRFATRLVSHLGRLGPIPSAAPRVDQIVLKLSYGDGARSATQSIQLTRSDRQEQLANERRNRTLVATPTQVAQGQ